MSNVVYFRGSRAQARQIVYDLAAMLTGRVADTLGIARGVFLALGFAALSDIKADFVRKSRGDVGEDGVKWPPLSKEYLAYGRRFGRGEQAALKKSAGLGGANRYAPGGSKGLLTADQLKRWRQIYSRVLRGLMLSMYVEKWSLSSDAEIESSRFITGEGGAKSRAAQIAWTVLKREGARTKLEVFGNRQVDINRDTGILLNSLSPGYLSNDHYDRPTAEGGEQQIFQAIGNGVIVGTNVPYAAAVNKQRPFLPAVAPVVWLERWAAIAVQALSIGARLAFQAGGRAR